MARASRPVREARHRDYKATLVSAAKAWFASHSMEVDSTYSYSLTDRERWGDNIILKDVVEYVGKQRKERELKKLSFALHKFVHNGLSSQAMLFNLVGPLIVRNDLQPLQIAFEAGGVPWPSGIIKASLEVEDREVFNERQAQPTSIDLVLEGDTAPALFVETKLVEQGFGGCSVFEDGDCCGRNPARSADSCYLHRIRRLYWERLGEFGFLAEKMADSPICPLTIYYQFFREVLFAIQKRGYFVLLFDKRSPVFFRKHEGGGDDGLIPFLLEFVPQQHRSCIHAVTIQAVSSAIRQTGRHNDWIDAFDSKYGLRP